jgi:hypothetical protein
VVTLSKDLLQNTVSLNFIMRHDYPCNSLYIYLQSNIFKTIWAFSLIVLMSSLLPLYFVEGTE